MANQAQSSRLDTALKLLLITFVSLVAFFTGAYVGKAMSDSDHQLKAMEADFQTQKTAAEKHKDLDVADKDALVDEEVAQMSDKIVKAEKDQLGESLVKENVEPKAEAKGHEAKGAEKVAEHGHDKTAEKVAEHGHEKAAEKVADHGTAKTTEKVAEHGAAKTTEKVADTSHEKAHEAGAAKMPEKQAKATREIATAEKPIKKQSHAYDDPSLSVKKSKLDLSEVHKTAERIANNEATTSDEMVSQKPETSRIPSSLPKSVGTASGPGFTVQVASFPTSEEAKKQVEELIKKGFPAFPIEATISGKTWYRVSLGNFKTQKEAAQYRLQLIKDSEIKKAIVAKVSP